VAPMLESRPRAAGRGADGRAAFSFGWESFSSSRWHRRSIAGTHVGVVVRHVVSTARRATPFLRQHLIALTPPGTGIRIS